MKSILNINLTTGVLGRINAQDGSSDKCPRTGLDCRHLSNATNRFHNQL